MMYYLNIIIAQTKISNDQSDGFGYVIAAFIAVWLFIAAYLFWLNRRQESLRREVEMLREEQLKAPDLQFQAEELTPAQKLEVGSQPFSRPDLGG